MKNKRMNDSFTEAIGQLKTVAVLAKTLEVMHERNENNPMYIPKNLELIDNIIKVFSNLRKELLLLLKEDIGDNNLEKN